MRVYELDETALCNALAQVFTQHGESARVEVKWTAVDNKLSVVVRVGPPDPLKAPNQVSAQESRETCRVQGEREA